LSRPQHNSSAQVSPSPSQVSPSPQKHLNTSQYGSEHDNSSVNSSRTASPDPNQRRDSNSSGTTTTPQMNFLQKQKEMRERENQVRRGGKLGGEKGSFDGVLSCQHRQDAPPHSPTGEYFDKPPIPPRGMPPPVPQRQSSVEKVSEVQVRQKNMNGNGELGDKRALVDLTLNFTPAEDHYSNTPSNRPYSLQQPQSRAPLVATNGSNGNGHGAEEVWMRQGDGRSSGKLRFLP
jgi:hypothetical protein